MTGTTRSRSRSSDRMPGHVESNRSIFSLSLRKLANRLPPNERKKAREPRKTGGNWNVKVSDADALALLRRIDRGESLTNVAQSASIRECTLRQWFTGTNRPSLARQIEKERAA